VNQQKVKVNGARSLKVNKFGTTYKVYVSGAFVTTGVYSDYSRFTGFKLTVPPGALFTNFIGTALR